MMLIRRIRFLFRRVRLNLRFLLKKEDAEVELDDELRFHLEQTIESNIRAGMGEEEARRQAVIAFGGVERYKEQVREARGLRSIEDLFRDVRHALQQFRRNPGFSVLAILTMALGIGATVAIFSVVNGVLIKPLPYHEPDGLFAVRQKAPALDIEQMGLSTGQYFYYRAENRTLEDLGVSRWFRLPVTGLDEPEQVLVLGVTEGILPLLGVRPALGRIFTAFDDTPEAPPTAILGYGYWQRRFGGDPDVIGTSLTVNGMPMDIVGVLEKRFSYLDRRPDLILPFQLDPTQASVGGFSFMAITRFKPGMTAESASADLVRMLPLSIDQYGGNTLDNMESWEVGPLILPLKEMLVGNASRGLLIILGAVGLVLLIACTNVANLFLVRTEDRRLEIAIRVSLGAKPTRIAWEFMVEGLCLGVIAGLIGIGLAWGGNRLLTALAPGMLPRLGDIGIDSTVLFFAFTVSLLGGLVLGLFPVLTHGSRSLVAALRHGSYGVDRAGRRQGMRNGLAVLQLALALVLLVSSGLMIRSVHALWQVHPGIDHPEEILTFTLPLPPSEAPDLEMVPRIHEQIVRQIEQIPGVISVGLSTSVPMDGQDYENTVLVEDRPDEISPTRRNNFVSEGYIRTMGIPLLAGRMIEWSDVHERRAVTLVSMGFAEKYWDSPEAAIGKRISVGPGTPWREIVGVVGNVHARGLDREPWPTVYWPMAVANLWGNPIFLSRTQVYSVRTDAADPQQLVDQVRDAVWSVNSNLPLAGVRTLKEIFDSAASRISFTMVLLSISAGLALLLGIVGLYGVISYSVSLRTRELGLRIAIGARGKDVMAMVLSQGLRCAAIGVAIGIVAAVGMTRLMTSILYGVSPTDPATYGVVAIILVVVTLFASYIPARRASSVDPIIALRYD